ncbi:hypothetical protein ABT024_01505 [Streptomyces sp. NPDC002812]|uniref:hypothetical protein n=1 Tax=Streptomyces sp. NPDC002812 TaxID=3154434 RepID=UPI00331B3E2E
MPVTISLVVLLGVILTVLLRTRTLGAGSALVAVGFGFFLAATGAADPINDFISAVLTAISGT